MSRRLNKVKRTFFFYQVSVLFCALGLTLGVIINGYIKNAKEDIQIRQNKIMDFIINSLQKAEEIPKIVKEFHIYFILDANDGSYIVPRKDAEEEGGLLWKEFRSKLTYQMQKQENGTITYPIKGPKEIFKSSKMLQYRTLDDFGWIVVTETDVPSDWGLVKNITTKKDLVNLLVGMFVGFFILKFMTDMYFMRLETQVADIHEYSLGNFNQNILKSSKKRGAPKKEVPEEVFHIDQQELPMVAAVNPKMNFSQKAIGAGRGSEISEENIPRDTYASGKRESRKKETFNAPKTAPQSKEEQAPSVQKTGDQVRVNVEGIKSPVLKKLISELRGRKQKG